GDRDHRRAEGVRRGRDRLVQDPAHAEGPREGQGRPAEEGEGMSAAATVAAHGTEKRDHTGPIIRAHDLWRTYQMGVEEIHALRGVSFEIPIGEYIAIM